MEQKCATFAPSAGSGRIVAFNQRDFAGLETFALRAVTPKEFLQEIGEIP
jgi:hypothetical protein